MECLKFMIRHDTVWVESSMYLYVIYSETSQVACILILDTRTLRLNLSVSTSQSILLSSICYFLSQHPLQSYPLSFAVSCSLVICVIIYKMQFNSCFLIRSKSVWLSPFLPCMRVDIGVFTYWRKLRTVGLLLGQIFFQESHYVLISTIH